MLIAMDLYKYLQGYQGDLVGGRPHGRGVEKFASGDMYEGEWHDGSTQGQGKYTNADGSYHVGMWHQNRMHGQGQHGYPNGDTFTGIWKRGMKHGPIQYTFSNGETLVGAYDYNTPVGDVTVTLKRKGVTHTFPWPNTDKDLYASNHAQAARKHASALAGTNRGRCIFSKFIYPLSYSASPGQQWYKLLSKHY